MILVEVPNGEDWKRILTLNLGMASWACKESLSVV